MKNLITILFFIFFGLACCVFAEENFPFVGEVTVDNLNIRAGFHTNFEILYKLKNKDKITVVEKKFNWYKIELPLDTTLFTNTKYIENKSDAEVAVLADRVNVRARPDLNSTVLCQVGKGDIVGVIEKHKPDWYRIKAPKNCFGWVNDKYVKYFSSVEEYNKEKQQELAKLSEQRNQSVEPKLKSKFEFEHVGVIKKVLSFFKPSGRYRLIQDEKTVCFLKGDKAVLNSFANLKVKVSGNLEKDSNYKYPVVIVEEISESK